MTSYWCFYFNFEHISTPFSTVSLIDFEQVNVSWVKTVNEMVNKHTSKVNRKNTRTIKEVLRTCRKSMIEPFARLVNG